MFRIEIAGVGCVGIYVNGTRFGNPAVFFDETTKPELPAVNLNPHAAILHESYFPGTEPHDIILESPVTDITCNDLPKHQTGHLLSIVGEFDGNHYLYDPRFRLFSNSLSSPKTNAGGDLVQATKIENPVEADKYKQVSCFNAPMTFLNEEQCVLSTEEDACSFQDPADALIELTYENLQKFYEASGKTKYVYAIDKLRQEDIPLTENYKTPCESRATSRWALTVDCTSQVPIEPLTASIFSGLIRDSSDKNPFVRDIVFPAIDVECHEEDVAEFDFTIDVDGQCWKNVNREHLQVFDFTPWTVEGVHPGGAPKITQWAENRTDSLFRLQYPSHHKDQWYRDLAKSNRHEVGRLGDFVRFRDLPIWLQTEEIAKAFGAIDNLESIGRKVVCGSPFEVASDPKLGGEVTSGAYAAFTINNVTTFGDMPEQRVMTWMDIATKGKDSLRQRVAWALSQILAVSPDSIDETHQTESWVVRSESS